MTGSVPLLWFPQNTKSWFHPTNSAKPSIIAFHPLVSGNAIYKSELHDWYHRLVANFSPRDLKFISKEGSAILNTVIKYETNQRNRSQVIAILKFCPQKLKLKYLQKIYFNSLHSCTNRQMSSWYTTYSKIVVTFPVNAEIYEALVFNFSYLSVTGSAALRWFLIKHKSAT